MAIAHSANASGQTHDLLDHLQKVAQLASTFANKFNARELGHWAGIWPDIGKAHPDFQKYLRTCETDPEKRHRGPEHKGAGTVVAFEKRCELLTFLIAGHHGGLPSKAQLKTWIGQKASSESTPG